MNTNQKAPVQWLEKSLVVFFSLLLLSLLIIFAIEPTIYTTTLPPGVVGTDRYPPPVILFLVALVVFICVLMYGILHHWRWLFFLMPLAFAGSVIQLPLDFLQLAGILPNPYPVWYSLYRSGVGFIELGFAVWMVQTYRHAGIWSMRRP